MITEASCDDDFCLAPLRGVTVRAYRNLHARWFTPPDRAVAPFIPTIAGERVKPLLLRDIDPGFGQSIPVIPQLIGKDPTQMRTLLRAFKAIGYRCADLNAGCPYPFIIRKGRGAGLMRDEVAFGRMLETGCEEMPEGFSVKVRLGIDSSSLLLARMPLINNMPLREMTIHARTARQMYEGTVDLNAFEEAMAACCHPVVYNGDIRSRQDYLRLKQRFPSVTRWMIGRGAACDPFLFRDLKNNVTGPRDVAQLKGFLDNYLVACQEELFGPASVLGRIKELWSYLHQGLCQGAKIWHDIRICRSVEEYQRVLTAFFITFPGFA